MKAVRKNIQMSEKIAKWYEKRAKELGVSQSSIMTIALNEYLEKQESNKPKK